MLGRECVISSGSVPSDQLMICFCFYRPKLRKSCTSWVMYRKYFTRGKWVWWNWQPDRLVQCNLWPPILNPPQNGCHQKPASPLPWVGYLRKETYGAMFFQYPWSWRLWLFKMHNYCCFDRRLKQTTHLK